MKKNAQLNAMIVEDDRALAAAMEFALVKRGVDVAIFRDPESALAVKGLRPDVIVVDIVIDGDVEGFALLDHLRTHPALSGIPRIVVTDYGTRVDAARARALGAEDYVMKADNDLAYVADAILALAKKGRTLLAPAQS